ncbi:MAG TPA: hypothetical protein VKR21_17395 [Solirubrobacteraceae bacterium]|nr:hypothetical protein [Solirubrobacteraceae bacterium]
MSLPTVGLRNLSRAACLLGAVLALAACGKSNHPPTSENDGVYITAGPITYQLQVSRELNQYATEDSQYLTGLPTGTASLTPTQEWYAVFLWAKNQTNRTQTPATNFDIVDTQGKHYYPVAVNPQANPYAWTSRPLAPGEIEPGPDTTASFGPTQGALLLFKLDSSVYDNRPLTLEIRGPNPTRRLWGTISLDL